jgi:hypothetical protein
LSGKEARGWVCVHCRYTAVRSLTNNYRVLTRFLDPVGDGALSLYTYAVGSPFEALLNNYMITAQALHPPDVRVGLNNSLTWTSVNGALEAAPAKAMALLQSLR